jgi:transporter family-2 protein
MNNLPAGLIAESAVLIAFFFASMFAILLRPLPTVQNLNELSWWAPLGGLAGALAVYAEFTLIDKIGAGTVNGLIITANILASIAIEHFGLLNTPVHTATIWRIFLTEMAGFNSAFGGSTPCMEALLKAA